MQPLLSPLSDGTPEPGGAVAPVPPPPNFTHWRLPFLHVKRTENPYGASRGNTGAKQAGLRYESLVQRAFNSDPFYTPHPAYLVTDRNGPRLIIPDGMLSSSCNSFVVVIEIKIRHMPEAYWQLEHKYAPPIRWHLGPGKRVYTLEICKSFDPAMPTPIAPRVYNRLDEFLADPYEGFNVFVWTP